MRLELSSDEEKRRESEIHSDAMMAAVVVDAVRWLPARAYGA